MANWAELLQSALVQGEVGRPKGENWRTVAEFAEEHGLSGNRAYVILSNLHRTGKVERVRAKVGTNWSYFYRPHETPTAKTRCTPTRQSLPPLRAAKRPHAR